MFRKVIEFNVTEALYHVLTALLLLCEVTR